MDLERTPPKEWTNGLANTPEPIRHFVLIDAWSCYDRAYKFKTEDKMNDMMEYERDNAAVTTGLCAINCVLNTIASAGLNGLPDRSFKRYLDQMEAAEAETPGGGVISFFQQVKPMMDKRFAILKGGPQTPDAITPRKPRKRRKSTKHLLENTEAKTPQLM